MTEFGPTHSVPPTGMHAWVEPDPGANPVATLAPGTQLQLLESRGAWAHVAADNGWRGWVDARQLVWGSVPPPGAMSPVYPSYAASRSTNGLAIASMVLGILWVWWIGSILAVVFGHVSLNQIKRSGGTQGGRGMAIAGVVLGWVGVGLFGLFVIAAVVAES